MKNELFLPKYNNISDFLLKIPAKECCSRTCEFRAQRTHNLWHGEPFSNLFNA